MRFYAALMLDELIHESPVWTVAEKYISPNYILALNSMIDSFLYHKRYKLDRGTVQTLMQNGISRFRVLLFLIWFFFQIASAFAHMSKMYCQVMDWWELAVLLEKYVERLNYGVREEVLPLMEIPGVKQWRARSLFNAGTSQNLSPIRILTYNLF